MFRIFIHMADIQANSNDNPKSNNNNIEKSCAVDDWILLCKLML